MAIRYFCCPLSLDFKEIARVAGHKMKTNGFHLNKDSGRVPMTYGFNLKWGLDGVLERMVSQVECFRR